jgi:hypothetical protein
MTLDALLDSLKQVFSRVASGPLRDRAWNHLRAQATRDLRMLLRQNGGQQRRLNYTFYSYFDSNGAKGYGTNSRSSAEGVYARDADGRARPEEVLYVSGSITGRGAGGRAVISMTGRRSNSTVLAIRRATDDREEGVRREGSRAVVRGSSEELARRLAELSGGPSRSASAPLPDDPPASP